MTISSRVSWELHNHLDMEDFSIFSFEYTYRDTSEQIDVKFHKNGETDTREIVPQEDIYDTLKPLFHPVLNKGMNANPSRLQIKVKETHTKVVMSVPLEENIFTALLTLVETREGLSLTENEKDTLTFIISGGTHIYNQHGKSLTSKMLPRATLSRTLSKLSSYKNTNSLVELLDTDSNRVSIGHFGQDRPYITSEFTATKYDLDSDVSMITDTE